MHSFKPSVLDTALCISCKRTEVDHTDKAICECCNNVGSHELYYDMLMCVECITKEKALQEENNKPENQAARVNAMLAQSRQIDQSIELKTDLFNAKTVAFMELKAAIEQDDNIANKSYALANETQTRIKHFSEVLFGVNAQKVELENTVRFYQTQLNQLASQLSQEERDKLKLQDITYTPTTKIVKPRAVTSKKFQKEEVRKFAAQYDVPEIAVQMLVISQNLTPENAAKKMRATMDMTKGN